jgi:hypothetical protein
MSTSQNPAWIRRTADLGDIELAQLGDQYPLLRINDNLAFDLVAWRHAASWTTNAIQPRTGGKLRILRDELISRGMENRPVIDAVDGWVADGNSRLLAYDDARRDGHDLRFPGFEIRQFDNDVQRHEYQVACAVVHRQLATKERKKLVRTGIAHHPAWTDNRLAILYGLSQDTVTRISDEMIDAGEVNPRPKIRIDAAGREVDVSKLKMKAKQTVQPNPLLPLVQAWHESRGGHGTTSAELLPIVESAGIDLIALGACKPEHDGTARLKAVTAWLGRQASVPIGGHVITVYRHSLSGFTVFSLVRRGDYRPDLVGKPADPGDDVTSENRNA